MGQFSDASPKLTAKVKDMVLIYSEMIKSQRKVESYRAASQEKYANDELVRFYKLEAKVNLQWAGLSQAQCRQAVDELVKDDFMTPAIGEVLTMFGGQVNMAPPPEPCVRM